MAGARLSNVQVQRPVRDSEHALLTANREGFDLLGELLTFDYVVLSNSTGWLTPRMGPSRPKTSHITTG